MNCPECNGPTRVLSTRLSHETSITRRRRCTICNAISFTVEVPVDPTEISCDRHHHIKKPALIRLLQAVYT